MIISRTPYRISFFGGGTDYPIWYRTNGGQVLAASIDKYVYVSCRRLLPFFEHRLRLVYSKIENCHSASDLQHPSAREVLVYLKILEGLEIHYDGDLPARSGVGSSSAFTVGLLNAISTMINKARDAEALARESIYIEQELVKEYVGSQDQVTAAYGGLNHITFDSDKEFEVNPVLIKQERLERLEAHLMMFFTGVERIAADIAKTYVPKMSSNSKQLNHIYELVDQAKQILLGEESLLAFGELLHEMWIEKRSLGSAISNSKIDEIYAGGLAAGAIGGKVLGAGGGGMVLFFVPPEAHKSVASKLSHLVRIPFRFEHVGSKIIFNDSQV